MRPSSFMRGCTQGARKPRSSPHTSMLVARISTGSVLCACSRHSSSCHHITHSSAALLHSKELCLLPHAASHMKDGVQHHPLMGVSRLSTWRDSR